MATLFFIGDSMIEFYDWQQRFPEHRAINLGRSGETTAELLARLPGILTLQPAPDWLLLMTGTNDVCMENFSFPATLARIIATCHAEPAKHSCDRQQPPAHLAALPYRRCRTPDERHPPRPDHGGGRLFSGRPWGSHRPHRPPPARVLAADGVHLEDHGYHLWAEAVEKHLTNLLP